TANTRVSQIPPGNTGVSQVPPGNTDIPQVPPGNTGMSQVPPANTGMSQVPLANTGIPQVPPANTGMSQVPPANTGIPQVPPGNTGIPQVPPGNTGMSQVPLANTGMSQVPPANTGMSQVPPANTGMSQVPHANTGVSQVPPANTGMSQVPHANTGVSQVPPANTGVSQVPPANTGVSQVPPANTGIPQVPPANTGVSQVPPANTGIPQVPPANTGIPQVPPANTGIPQVPPANTGMSQVPPANTDIPQVPPANTGVSQVLPANTGMSQVPPANTGVSQVPPANTGIPPHPLPLFYGHHSSVNTTLAPPIIANTYGSPQTASCGSFLPQPQPGNLFPVQDFNYDMFERSSFYKPSRPAIANTIPSATNPSSLPGSSNYTNSSPKAHQLQSQPPQWGLHPHRPPPPPPPPPSKPHPPSRPHHRDKSSRRCCRSSSPSGHTSHTLKHKHTQISKYKSHGRSHDRLHERSHDKSRNRSHDKSRNRPHDRSQDRSRNRSHDRSQDRARNRSHDRSSNRSRTPSSSRRDKAVKQSKSKRKKKQKKSKSVRCSRSKSRSPRPRKRDRWRDSDRCRSPAKSSKSQAKKSRLHCDGKEKFTSEFEDSSSSLTERSSGYSSVQCHRLVEDKDSKANSMNVQEILSVNSSNNSTNKESCSVQQQIERAVNQRMYCESRLQTLQSELVMLCKQQNEVMRKKRRDKDGHKDPVLVENAVLQEEVSNQIKLLKNTVKQLTEALQITGMSMESLTCHKQPYQYSKQSSPSEFNSQENTDNSNTTVKNKFHSQGFATSASIEKETSYEQLCREGLGMSRSAREKDQRTVNKGADRYWVPHDEDDSTSSLSYCSQNSQHNDKGTTGNSEESRRVSYEYFDPGNHWCRHCNLVTSNIYELFHHLQSKKHKTKLSHYDRPWLPESLKNPSSKPKTGQVQMAPIKGVEFLMSTSAFYCTLCEEFSGDVLCAETHVKSERHNAAYQKHIQKNPFYEKRLNLDKAAGLQSFSPDKGEKRKHSDDHDNCAVKKLNKENDFREKRSCNVASVDLICDRNMEGKTTEVSSEEILKENFENNSSKNGRESSTCEDKDKNEHHASSNTPNVEQSWAKDKEHVSNNNVLKPTPTLKSKIAIKLTGKTAIKPFRSAVIPPTIRVGKMPGRHRKPAWKMDKRKGVNKCLSLDDFLTCSHSSVPVISDERETAPPHLTTCSHSNVPVISDERETAPPHLTTCSHSNVPVISDEWEAAQPHLTTCSNSSVPVISDEWEAAQPHLTTCSNSNVPVISDEWETAQPHLTTCSNSSVPVISDEWETAQPHLTTCSNSSVPVISDEWEAAQPHPPTDSRRQSSHSDNPQAASNTENTEELSGNSSVSVSVSQITNSCLVPISVLAALPPPPPPPPPPVSSSPPPPSPVNTHKNSDKETVGSSEGPRLCTFFKANPQRSSDRPETHWPSEGSKARTKAEQILAKHLDDMQLLALDTASQGPMIEPWPPSLLPPSSTTTNRKDKRSKPIKDKVSVGSNVGLVDGESGDKAKLSEPVKIPETESKESCETSSEPQTAEDSSSVVEEVPLCTSDRQQQQQQQQQQEGGDREENNVSMVTQQECQEQVSEDKKEVEAATKGLVKDMVSDGETPEGIPCVNIRRETSEKKSPVSREESSDCENVASKIHVADSSVKDKRVDLVKTAAVERPKLTMKVVGKPSVKPVQYPVLSPWIPNRRKPNKSDMTETNPSKKVWSINEVNSRLSLDEFLLCTNTRGRRPVRPKQEKPSENETSNENNLRQSSKDSHLAESVNNENMAASQGVLADNQSSSSSSTDSSSPVTVLPAVAAAVAALPSPSKAACYSDTPVSDNAQCVDSFTARHQKPVEADLESSVSCATKTDTLLSQSEGRTVVRITGGFCNKSEEFKDIASLSLHSQTTKLLHPSPIVLQITDAGFCETSNKDHPSYTSLSLGANPGNEELSDIQKASLLINKEQLAEIYNNYNHSVNPTSDQYNQLKGSYTVSALHYELPESIFCQGKVPSVLTKLQLPADKFQLPSESNVNLCPLNPEKVPPNSSPLSSKSDSLDNKDECSTLISNGARSDVRTVDSNRIEPNISLIPLPNIWDVAPLSQLQSQCERSSSQNGIIRDSEHNYALRLLDSSDRVVHPGKRLPLQPDKVVDGGEDVVGGDGDDVVDGGDGDDVDGGDGDDVVDGGDGDKDDGANAESNGSWKRQSFPCHNEADEEETSQPRVSSDNDSLQSSESTNISPPLLGAERSQSCPTSGHESPPSELPCVSSSATLPSTVIPVTLVSASDTKTLLTAVSSSSSESSSKLNNMSIVNVDSLILNPSSNSVSHNILSSSDQIVKNLRKVVLLKRPVPPHQVSQKSPPLSKENNLKLLKVNNVDQEKIIVKVTSRTPEGVPVISLTPATSGTNSSTSDHISSSSATLTSSSASNLMEICSTESAAVDSSLLEAAAKKAETVPKMFMPTVVLHDIKYSMGKDGSPVSTFPSSIENIPIFDSENEESDSDVKFESSKKVYEAPSHLEMESHKKLSEVQNHVENDSPKKLGEVSHHLQMEFSKKVYEAPSHLQMESPKKLGELPHHVEMESPKKLGEPLHHLQMEYPKKLGEPLHHLQMEYPKKLGEPLHHLQMEYPKKLNEAPYPTEMESPSKSTEAFDPYMFLNRPPKAEPSSSCDTEMVTENSTFSLGSSGSGLVTADSLPSGDHQATVSGNMFDMTDCKFTFPDIFLENGEPDLKLTSTDLLYHGLPFDMSSKNNIALGLDMLNELYSACGGTEDPT
ncbi:hypothetical protein Ahia01_001034300, partial [Argonauta hians]